MTDQDDRGQAVLDRLTEIEALIDGKQLPGMLRIKALRRLNCCALSIGGVEEREHGKERDHWAVAGVGIA